MCAMINTNEKFITSSNEKTFSYVPIGIYKILFNGRKLCCLFKEELQLKLNDYCSKQILKVINKSKIHYEIKEYNLVKYFDYNINLECEINSSNKIISIIYDQQKLEVHREESILKLQPKTNYLITDFKIYKTYGIITSEGRRYFISSVVGNILEKYFKCENKKISCTYDNKVCHPKLTLITDEEIETTKGYKMLLCSLKLEINRCSFTFYINKSEYLNYSTPNEYSFIVFLVLGNRLLGYDYIKDKYYDLRYEQNLILSNVNQEIASKFDKLENQNVYTYVLSNGNKRGVKITVNGKVTRQLGGLSNAFKKVLDISLLSSQIPEETGFLEEEIEDL